ncbi:hypothetical protein CLCR_00687 [Cladophialophora carrionii]|uniref:Uncharacterized protein n=1 Tax=Cladophialophora carrionii TaxID=86049 RepID=A0A1C1C6L2_9EURO|nr:hypothetical protein CLCR_00687 [Cladophialophora carrionii]
MEEGASSQTSQPQLLPATTFGQSAARSMSRLFRPSHDPGSSGPSPAPGKTFVVPLFLSRSSTQTQAFARGALSSSTRSRSSTRSVIEDAVRDVPPVAVRRDNQTEVSDLYTGSLHHPEPLEPIPLARNMDDEPTPSERQAMRSYRSGSSSSTQTSKRSGRQYGIFSRKAYRDPVVSAKARISFAFGVALLVALIIYRGTEQHPDQDAGMQGVILEPDDTARVNLLNKS